MQRINKDFIIYVDTVYNVKLKKSNLYISYPGKTNSIYVHGKICVTVNSKIITNIINKSYTKLEYNKEYKTRIEKVGMFSYDKVGETKNIKDCEVTTLEYKEFIVEKEFLIDVHEVNKIMLPLNSRMFRKNEDEHITQTISRYIDMSEFKKMSAADKILSICDHEAYRKNILDKLNINYDILKDSTFIF